MGMEGDSCPRGHEFEFQSQILPKWIVFHIYLRLKRPKNIKEARDGPLKTFTK